MCFYELHVSVMRSPKPINTLSLVLMTNLRTIMLEGMVLNIWDNSGSEQAGDPGRSREQDGEDKRSVWEFGVAWEVWPPVEGDITGMG